MSDAFYIEGLPIKDKTKVFIVISAIFLATINHLLPVFHEILDYSFRNYVSIGLIIIFLVFSIGSKVAETIVIGVAIVAIVSNIWDFTVRDISDFRRKILIYSFIILILASVFGEVSIIKVFKNQLGG